MKFALRSLLKSRSFTLVALVTLALGIGANTSMYTVVDTLLFGSAPYPEADRIVRIFGTTPRSQNERFSLQEIQEMRAHGHSFESLTTLTYGSNTLAEPGVPAERLPAVNFSQDFFATFQTQPFLGRAFTADEQIPGKNQVAILDHALWQRRFGGDRDIIGRTMRLDGEPVEIVGVMPPDFTYPLVWGDVDLWRPLALPPQVYGNPENRTFSAIGRLKPGVTPAQAAAELQPLLARWAKDRPKTNTDRGLRVISLQASTMDNEFRFYVWLMFGLSLFVLLIACANLANLQLARATAKLREFAVRSALGASRARLIRHQLAESLLLALAGGSLGLFVAELLNEYLGAQIRLGTHQGLDLHLNGPILAMTVIISLLAGLVFGLVPALLASRLNVITILKQQSRGATSGHHRLRNLLIVSQVALALALLGGAGVMIRGFNAFLHRDNGWDTDRIFSAAIRLPAQAAYDTDEERLLALEKISRRLAQIPGAEHTGICSNTPIFSYSALRPLLMEGQTASDAPHLPNAGYILVASDFFATLGIPLVEGRLFSSDLRAGGSPQVVVGQALARQLWPNQSALGKRLGEIVGQNIVWREIIGVVRDIEFPGNPARPPTLLQVYKPMVHEPWSYMNLVVRGQNPASFSKAIQQAIVDIDADIAIRDAQTIPQAIDRFQHNYFLMGRIMSWFALLGLGLAALGLYGVISQIVAQRTGEFGIRLALGATPASIMGMILNLGLKLILVGLTIGLGLATVLNLTLGKFIPRAVSADPLTLAGTALLLGGVALLASWIPARRATKADPIEALRAE